MEKETPKFFIPGKKKTISSKTIRDHLILFRSFLKFLRIKRIIDDDFNEIIILPPADTDKEDRDKYSDEEVYKLFTSPDYLKQRYNIQRFPRFWVPLIALYTGARLNEICLLTVDDIIIENGIHCFYFTDDRTDDRKRLKTKQSKRKFPIHKKLIEMGFLDFYKKVKNATDIRNRWYKKHNKKIKIKKDEIEHIIDNHNKENLFFTLSYNDSNKFGGALSKWFNTMKKKVLPLNKKKLDFHSFRHTLGSNLSKNGVEYDKGKKLGGWKNYDMPGTYYHHDIETYKEAVDEATYPLLEKEISKLMPDLEKEKNFLKR